jgi:hypothetical protein
MYGLLYEREFVTGARDHGLPLGVVRNVMGIAALRKKGDEKIAGLKTLYSLLQRARANGATDARDKVFALLGIATEIGDLKADYRKSLKEVYVDTAWALIKTGGLSLLSVTQASHTGSELPSWVPDWRRRFDLHYISYSKGGEDTEQKVGNGIAVYKAAGDHKFKLSPSFDKYKLMLKGKECAQIARILFNRIRTIKRASLDQYKQGHVDHSEDDVICVFAAEAEVLGLVGEYEHTGEPMGLAYLRTLVADLLPLNGRALETTDKTHFPAFMQRYFWSVPTLEITESELLVRSVRELTNKARRLNEGRSLALTKNGYLAWVPEVSVENDMIFIVAGSPAPLVLRAQGGEYEYLGESYVHGIMDGELVEMVDRTGWDTITLI